ncbi:3-deoxy-D-manno-oct-2-ulosonate III transferase WaaZ [Pantoea sp.]|uniref:3-deoxy-D-manno-oct-2-ulosonate III transferase WaaZ n=1 Tax=Pantoea sp. TaxID=69393 RepID=UPI002898A72D|nr:3-deoxy-D-manno-oct-2-ulosonate III transferase WaaZ [Pantoea sp.]
MIFDKQALSHVRERVRAKNAIIFLSGPSAVKTPLELLASNDVIAVNGSACWLIDNNIRPFIYMVTDIRFITSRESDFERSVERSEYCVINEDVYAKASAERKKWLEERCYIIHELYKREKAGPLKKLKFWLYCRQHPEVIMHVPASRKKRILGFSKDISVGYCNCKTVAYACMQMAYSLSYEKIICAGLDLSGSFTRFYDQSSASTLVTELQQDLDKILPLFTFMRKYINPPVYTLSLETSVPYDDIPLIELKQLGYH